MPKKIYTEQPARLMYPFDKGWKVIAYVGTNVFSRTSSAAMFWFGYGGDWRDKARYASNIVKKYWCWSIVVGCAIAGAVQYVSALVLVAVFISLQFLFLVLWAGLALVFMAGLAVFNFLYSNIYKIYNRCPDCHEQMPIPIYVCPNCATEHTRLWPSVYGVFNHRCHCGRQLPTLNLFGRKKLIQKCAHCRTPMNSEIGAMVNVHIPVIGGPSTGKSNYIFMATDQLIKNLAKPRGYLIGFPDSKHQAVYDNNLRRLSSGSALAKTPDIVPQAYNLSIRKSAHHIGNIVYFYDAAGEAYTDEVNTAQQVFYRFIHGLVFIVDPFAIESFARQHAAEIAALRTQIRPSELDVQQAFERMKAVLESSVGFKKGRKFPQPIAVIVTKTDALNLEYQIGRTAARNLMRRDHSIRLETDAIHYLVEHFLNEHQLGNFVRNLYMSFENVTFYSCSSLGRLPDESDHRPFKPTGVLEPLVWLLGETHVLPALSARKAFVDREHKVMSKGQGNFLDGLKYYYWDSLLSNHNGKR